MPAPYGSRDSYGSGGYGQQSRSGYGGGRAAATPYGSRPARAGNFNDIEHNSTTCRRLFKNFYSEHADVSVMPDSQVTEFRQENQMTLQGSNIPRPMQKLEHGSWPQTVMNTFTKNGFTAPTPIQAQGWPMALSGRNLIGIAQTGSGKTLSFVLPAFIHILAQKPVERGEGPVCLVLAPTRELAVQINQVVQEFGAPLGIRNSCPQIGELNRSPQIVTATPGRLLDLLKMGKTTLRPDRMLDMGFEEPLREIVSQIRPDRQMLFWSATWPKSVQREDTIQAITQTVKVVPSYDKEAALCDTLKQIWETIPGEEATKKMERTIIFCNQKHLCDKIEQGLTSDGWGVMSIHGDKDQREREYALKCFKSGDCPILVATDVAARGLDVKELKHVINFDFPKNVEDFVHRIGRTGRGGESGSAYTFFDPKVDRKNAGDLVQLMTDAGQEVPHDISALVQYGGRGGGSRGGSGGRWRGGSSSRGGGGGGGYGRKW
ncbi:Ddx5 protein [Obelidium mucronatum]|nr:Ddx5 protein [Obelidium mucronatum]